MSLAMRGMIVLGIETSGQVPSVALLCGGEVMAERQVPMEGSRRSSALIEVVDQMFRSASVSLNQLQLVAVSIGPGSFTGLRIGVTFAKTLAYAVGCGVTGVNSLHAAAESADAALIHSPILHAVADAQRGEMFHQVFRKRAETPPPGERGPSWDTVGPWEIVTPAALAAKVGASAAFAGPGVGRYRDELLRARSDLTLIACESTAVSVARLGIASQPEQRGPWSLLPDYGRLSSAEEKREQTRA